MSTPDKTAKTSNTARRPRRRVGVWLGGFVLVAAIVVGLAIFFLPLIARPVVRSVVAGLDVGAVEFTIERIGWRSATVNGISMGDPQGDEPFAAISAAQITYDPLDLWAGRADSLTLDDLHMRARIKDGTLDLGVLEPLLDLARGSDDGADAAPPLQRVTLNDARIDLDTPDGRVTAMVNGEVLLADGDALDTAMTAAIDLAISGDIARGSARLSGSLAGGAASAKVEALVLEATHDLIAGTLSISGPDAGGTAALAMDEAGTLSGQLDGAVTYESGAADGVVDSAAGPVSFASGDVLVEATYVPGAAGGALAGLAGRATLGGLALESRYAALQGTVVLADGETVLVLNDAGRLNGEVKAGLVYEPAAGDPVSSVHGDISAVVDFDTVAMRGDVRLSGCMPVAVSFSAQAGFSLDGVKLCPQGDAPLVALDLSADEPQLHAEVLVPPVTFAVNGTARGTAPQMQLSAVLADGSPLEATAALSGGDMTLPGQKIGLRGIAGRVVASLGGAQAGPHATLTLDKGLVRDLQPAARFAPVQISAVLALDGDGRLSGPVKVKTPTGSQLVAGDLRHALGSGRGGFSFATPTLTFAEKGLQPHLLAPVLSGVVAAVTGTISATGSLGWTRGGIASSGADLVISDVDLQASAARFEGISGEIEFSSLVPVRTDGAQKVSIAVLDAGVPLTGGEALVDVRGNGDIVIENAHWPFAGGELVLTSGALNTADAVQTAKLSALKVDLRQLLTMVDLDGLTGDGQLGGSVPIEIRDGSVFVTHAVLSAEPGGVLRYSTAGTSAAGESAEGANIAFQALENFHFEVLSVEIDGPVDGELTLKVVLRGANPDLFEGYPVHMNITTQGAFMELLRRGTVGFRALDIVTGKEETGGFDIERVGPAPQTQPVQ